MNTQLRFASAAVAIAAQFVISGSSLASTHADVPGNLQVQPGNVLYLKASATGTQNYMCLPSAAGPAWSFVAPQATLFVPIPWFGNGIQQQVSTHFLSANPIEGGTPRPTWQNSVDSSEVWGKAIASSTDPTYVAPGAIPWLLVQAVGTKRGPSGGGSFAQTIFIQRINTVGGVAPAAADCTESTIGLLRLVPYRADYLFYKAN